jgi:hypothetical protein
MQTNHKYQIKGTIHGDDFVSRKLYDSRQAANSAVDRMLDSNGLVVQTVIQRDKHMQEFYCGDKCAFWVSRV